MLILQWLEWSQVRNSAALPWTKRHTDPSLEPAKRPEFRAVRQALGLTDSSGVGILLSVLVVNGRPARHRVLQVHDFGERRQSSSWTREHRTRFIQFGSSSVRPIHDKTGPHGVERACKMTSERAANCKLRYPWLTRCRPYPDPGCRS